VKRARDEIPSTFIPIDYSHRLLNIQQLASEPAGDL